MLFSNLSWNSSPAQPHVAVGALPLPQPDRVPHSQPVNNFFVLLCFYHLCRKETNPCNVVRIMKEMCEEGKNSNCGSLPK